MHQIFLKPNKFLPLKLSLIIRIRQLISFKLIRMYRNIHILFFGECFDTVIDRVAYAPAYDIQGDVKCLESIE